ncbi:Serine/threonine-protein kinase Chk1, partial [Stegodyphus mimosarum]
MGQMFVEGWEIVQVLGEGAYGEVNLIVNTTTQAAVAVKVLDAQKEPAALEAIKKEVFIHRRLNHERIIKYYGHRVEGDEHFIFMEYASGGELFDKVEPDVGMPHSKAQKYFLQITAGVEYLHSLGITHRDLKPENILLDANDDVKITDFGLATIFRHKGKERELSNRCGTLPYIAPEVFFRKYKAEPADVWSCGILLVVMLAGELPWNEATAECNEYVFWRRSDYSQSPWNKIDNLPLALLRKILCPVPSKRYTILEIQNHIWCKKILPDEGTSQLSGTTTSKRLCSELDSSSVLKEESGSKLSFSQPAQVLRDSGNIDGLSGNISSVTVGVSFSQPVDPENMILASQFKASQTVSKTTLPIGTRLTRFCIKRETEAVCDLLLKVFEKFGYSFKRSAPGQLTVT